MRYPQDGDGLDGAEGRFLACFFWLAESWALQGEYQEARRIFARAAACGNDLGFFAEEWDDRDEALLGNVPQGLTHLSLIAAAVAFGKG